MDQLAEWIISRKIATRSLARHFAPWKSRYFVLDATNALLGIRTPQASTTTTNTTNNNNNSNAAAAAAAVAGVGGGGAGATSSTLLIPLSTPSLRITRHNYCIDDMFWLSIKYWDRSTDYEREVVMKFETLQHLLRWKEALEEVALQSHRGTMMQTQPYWRALREYMQEKFRLQEIAREIERTDDAAGGIYYAHNNGDNNTNSNNDRIDERGNSFTADDLTSSDDHALALESPTTATTLSASAQAAADHHSAACREASDSGDYEKLLTYPRQLRVPKMCILLMVVGTRGDMQPFIQLGRRLLRDGHRVRVATHACFRETVLKKGLEFYPLAGDPVKLSEFMVKTQGCVIPTTPELIREVPAYHAMMVDVINSCWDACTKVDPELEVFEFSADQFRPHAIIANPVCYAHIHCAEALRVPLHLMFPQPWSPTKAFPHPLACHSYKEGWSVENFISYQVVDRMMWASFERDINQMRQQRMGLEPVRAGQAGWNLLNILKVPFVKMWSPSFVPKPKDWPDHIDIVGCFFEQEEADLNNPLVSLEAHRNHAGAPHEKFVSRPSPATHVSPPSETFSIQRELLNNAGSETPLSCDRHPSCATPFSPSIEQDFQPSPALLKFLNASSHGAPIVFVGFGSMVIEDLESVLSLFLEAAALVGVRIIAQMGWSIISEERFLELALEAQLKASIVRETEMMNMDSSIIFPSKQTKITSVKEDHAPEEPVALSLHEEAERNANIQSLGLSMRSVQSTPDVVSEECSPTPSLYSSTHSSVHHSQLSPHRNQVSSEMNEVSSLSDPDSRTSAAGGSTQFQQGPGATKVRSGSLSNWLRGAAEGITATLYGTSSNVQATKEPVNAKRTVASRDNDISAAWDEVEVSQWSAPKDAFFLGPCPHSWLFPRIDAVVHHGGAGTTASGLRYGCPTWICPFFGDQHFWGEMIYRSRLGPRPCPVKDLTLAVVTEGLTSVTSPDRLHAVATISAQMRHENGVENSIAAFYRHLPLESMLCDVSLFEKKYVLADWYCPDCKLKMCTEVAVAVHSSPLLHMQEHNLVRCSYKNWSLPSPENAVDGLVQGIGGFIHEVSHGMTDVVYDPVKGIYTEGLTGAAHGLRSGLYSLVTRPIQGGNVLVQKLVEGVSKGWLVQPQPASGGAAVERKVASAEVAASLRRLVESESRSSSVNQSTVSSEPGYLEQHLTASKMSWRNTSELPGGQRDFNTLYLDRSQVSVPAALFNSKLSQEGDPQDADGEKSPHPPTKSASITADDSPTAKSEANNEDGAQECEDNADHDDDVSLYYEEDSTPLLLFRSMMDEPSNSAALNVDEHGQIDDLTMAIAPAPASQVPHSRANLNEDLTQRIDWGRMTDANDVLAAIGFTDGYDHDRITENDRDLDDAVAITAHGHGSAEQHAPSSRTDPAVDCAQGHSSDAIDAQADVTAKRATIAAHTTKMVQRLMDMEEQHRRQLGLQGLRPAAADAMVLEDEASNAIGEIANEAGITMKSNAFAASPTLTASAVARAEAEITSADVQLSSSTTKSLVSVFRRAQMAQQVFLTIGRSAGANESTRFLTIPQFVAVIHQALARQHALAAPSNDDSTAAATAAAATAAGRGGELRAEAQAVMAEEKQLLAEQYHLGENNEIMTHLIQMLCGSKMYIDFVDFVFFCEAIGIDVANLQA